MLESTQSNIPEHLAYPSHAELSTRKQEFCETAVKSLNLPPLAVNSSSTPTDTWNPTY